MNDGLYVYLIENSERHWVVARDADDAWSIFNEPEYSMNEDKATEDSVSITRLDDAMPLGIWDEDGVRVERHCAMWVKEMGRGPIGSTVY